MSVTTKVLSLVILPLAFGAMLAVPVQASAATEDAVCTVAMTGSTNTANKAGSRWTLTSNGSATGTIKVTGNANCKQTVTIAAWEAPNGENGRPYDQQKLVSHFTETYSVGTHSISIAVPDCFYQLDMIRGANAAGINGTAQYQPGSLLGSLHGGTKSCVVTPPVTPPTPQPPVTPAAPTELPKTGVGSNVAIVASAGMVLGTAFQYYRRLRTA
jgi:hypothetical protein